jgi:hypothetical protein
VIGDWVWCPEHGYDERTVDEHAEQIGWEEKARPMLVVDLECGYSVELPLTWGQVER